MEAGKESFMQEVRDNFLLCRLCNGEFDKPKALPCMHTFCHGCLVKYAEDNRHSYRYSTYSKPISCPVCRRRTDITKTDVDSLPDNFLITSLTGIINEKTAKSHTCEICTRRSKSRLPAATHRCLDCDKQLCKRCVAQHASVNVTQHHSLYSLDSTEKLMCADHTEEAVRFICRTCSKCVCIFCTYTDHKSCDLISITEGSANYRQEMEETVASCQQRMQTINSRLDFIQTWERCYSQTRDHILTTATDFLTQIESQRQAFLSRLDSVYGPEVLQLLGKKEELMVNLEGLSSACKVKDNINDGHSIEALLIHSELQNKVKHLLDTPLPVTEALVSTDDINISFEKGGVNLGCLVRQTEGAEPEYITETAEDMRESVWCRKCRSRSQSRLKDSETQSDFDKLISNSLKKYISDTDLSLTDVSALDNNSSLGDENPSIAVITGSMPSDLDKISSDCSDFEVQVDINLPRITRTTDTQYTSEDFQSVTDSEASQETVLEQSQVEPLCQADMWLPSEDVLENEIVIADSSSMTEPELIKDQKQYRDQFTQYQGLTPLVETGCDPINLTSGKDQSVQHHIETSNSFTEPHCTAFTSESATETESIPLYEKGIQASCAIIDAASCTDVQVQEAGTETVQLEFNDSFVQCEDMASQRVQTKAQAIQTYPVRTFDCFTNTEQKLTQDKSVGRIVLLMNRAVSTEKVEGSDVSSQTPVRSTQDKSVGQERYWCSDSQETQCLIQPVTHDFSSNTAFLESQETACGSDLPIDNFSNAATATDIIMKRHVALTVCPLSRSVGTLTMPKDSHNRACGTERPGIRHVALTVRPKVSHRATDPMPNSTSTVGSGDSGWECVDFGVNVHLMGVSQSTDTADLIQLANNSTSSAGLVIGPSIQCQTNKVNTANNFTMMIEPLFVDKCTNTPSQLPEERLQTFKRTQSVESISRLTQTDVTMNFSMLPAAVSSMLPEFPNSILHASYVADWATASDRPACDFPQSQSDTSPSYRLSDTTKQGEELSPTALNLTNQTPYPNPPTNQFTHSVHNPIVSQYNPANEIAALQTGAISKPIMCDQSTSTLSLTQLIQGERSNDVMDHKISECISKLRQVTKKLQYSSTSDMSASKSHASSSTEGTSSPITTPRSDPDISRSTLAEQTVNKTTTNQQDSVPIQAYTGDPSQAQRAKTEESYLPRPLLVSPDSVSVHPLDTVIQVKNFSKTSDTKRKLMEPSISYVKPQRLDPVTSSVESDISPTSRHKTHSRTTNQASPNIRSANKKSWDLKTLVQQEDQAKLERMRKRREYAHASRASEQLSVSPARRLSSDDGSMVESGQSSCYQSANSSIYGSSESLNLVIPGRGAPRRAPKVPVKVMKPSVISTSEAVPPAITVASSLPPLVAPPKPPRGTISGLASHKAKARSGKVESAAMLGTTTSRSRSSSCASEKSGLTSSTESSRMKTKGSSPRSLVSSVMKKVQSIGKPKSPTASHSLKHLPVTLTRSTDSKDYPSEACAVRLANHAPDNAETNQSPRFQPKSVDVKLMSASSRSGESFGIKPYLPSMSTSMNKSNQKKSQEKQFSSNARSRTLKKPAFK